MKKERLSEKHPIIAEKIDSSLHGSIKEGSYAATMGGFGISYLSPYAIAMNATSAQVGLLSALASLVPSIVQLKSSKLIEKYSRKKIAVRGAFLEALMFLPVILVGILFFLGIAQQYMVWGLIIFVALLYGFGGAIHPAWFSWMGSLVPEDKRGKYFSRRNRVTGFFSIVSLIIGALVLDYSKTLGFVMVGFGILFFLAFLARAYSAKLLKEQYEPRLKIRKRDYFSFKQFFKKAPETPFGRFAIYSSVMKLVVSIAGPFWAVYMLRNLGFSYVWFMALTVSATIFQLVFYPMLGKFSDKFGNIKLLKTASLFIFLTPLAWVLSSVLPLGGLSLKIYLLFIPQLIGGFAWAGFNLSTNNYIYDSVKRGKQGFGSAYFNFMSGLGMFLGAGIGSLIALMNISFMNPLLFIFLISGVCRFLVFIIGTRYLKEVRHVKEFSPQFIVKEFKPVQGLIREFHNMNHLKKDIEHYV